MSSQNTSDTLDFQFWKCTECFVKNDLNDENCICCGKPLKSAESAPNNDLENSIENSSQVIVSVTANPTDSKKRISSFPSTHSSNENCCFSNSMDLTCVSENSDTAQINGSRFSFGIIKEKFVSQSKIKDNSCCSTPKFGSYFIEDNLNPDFKTDNSITNKKTDFKTGIIYTWGSNECDQLPVPLSKLNETGALPVPCLVNKLLKQQVLQVSCGALHTLILLSDGSLVSWGCNDDGALGRGKDILERIPGRISTIPGSEIIFSISCGDSHSAAISIKGSCYIWGSYRDSSGCLGIPSYLDNCIITDREYLPQKIQNLSGTPLKIVSGENHTALLCITEFSTSVLYLWGNNEFGQLSIEPGKTFKQKQQCLIPRACDFLFAKNISNVFCGRATTFFEIRRNSNIPEYYGVGRNSSGELGIGEKSNIVYNLSKLEFPQGTEIEELTSCQFTSVALDKLGNLYTWGSHFYLGEPESTDRLTPKIIMKNAASVGTGSDTIYAIDKNNYVYAWGEGQMFQIGDGNDYTETVQNPIKLQRELFNNQLPLYVCGGSQHAVALVFNNTYLLSNSPINSRLIKNSDMHKQFKTNWDASVIKKIKKKRLVITDTSISKRCKPSDSFPKTQTKNMRANKKLELSQNPKSAQKQSNHSCHVTKNRKMPEIILQNTKKEKNYVGSSNLEGIENSLTFPRRITRKLLKELNVVQIK